MMGWYVAYGVCSVLCAVWWITKLIQQCYFVRLGELIVILIVSAVPVVNFIMVLVALCQCKFWRYIVWSKNHD